VGTTDSPADPSIYAVNVPFGCSRTKEKAVRLAPRRFCRLLAVLVLIAVAIGVLLIAVAVGVLLILTVLLILVLILILVVLILIHDGSSFPSRGKDSVDGQPAFYANRQPRSKFFHSFQSGICRERSALKSALWLGTAR